ncbi:hypothetical protein BV898_14361 [Hypsibius exemplaris]|uniref:Receptor ligand binding region domain-containing protein n=1 Tax=Hypsibius exemplaris TaxID=2072580 RepID=A0A9X6NFF5_HYPEX|nr:hypothetical protein BV898_14361 [Hypsibius exemplaris]
MSRDTVFLLGAARDTVFLLALILGSLVVPADNARPRIALATTIIKVPEANTSNFDAIQTSGPAVDLGVEHLRRTYAGTFNFSHTYLMDPSRPTAALLVDDVYNFAAKFLYANEDADSRAFLSPCAQEQTQILRLTKDRNKNILTEISSSPGAVDPTESYPQRFSLSPYPSPQSFTLIYALLLQNNWTNILGLVDTAFIEREYFSRGSRAVFKAQFNGKNPGLRYIRYHDLEYSSSHGYSAVEKTLRTVAETSRIVFLFGSGKSSLMVMRTAEKIGMTNGEYVFFMLTWSRYGFSIDSQNDSWWRVTDATADQPILLRGYVSRATIVISFRRPYQDTPRSPLRQLGRKFVETARQNYNHSYKDDQVPIFVYGAFEMYAVYGMLLNETYAQTGRILDGLELGSLLRNRTFHLPTGDVSFSASGERNIDIIGEVLNPVTGNYTTCLLFDAKAQKLAHLSDIATLWPSGLWPPPNEPLCGYLGNYCTASAQMSWSSLAGVSAAAVVAVTAFLLLLYRKSQQHVDTETWWLLGEPILMASALRSACMYSWHNCSNI